jgi:hypothetical protein
MRKKHYCKERKLKSISALLCETKSRKLSKKAKVFGFDWILVRAHQNQKA